MAELIQNYDNGSSIKVMYYYSQNANKNQSTLTMTLYAKRDSAGPSWSSKCNAYIQLDGEKVMTYTGSFKIGSSWVKIGSTVSNTVTHSTDGSKNVNIIGFFDSLGLTAKLANLTVSGNVQLSAIPQASSFTLSANTVTAGSTRMAVNITRNSSSFTHTVQWKFGSHTQINSNVSTSSTYTIPESWLDAIPNSVSGTGIVTVTTYNGNNKIGSSSKNFTVQAASTVAPTFTGIAFTRIDEEVPSGWGVYVKTKSKVKAAITGAAGVYGSTIRSYHISGGGYSGTASSLTTGFLNTAGTVTFTAKITDSRGRTATKTSSISVVDYSPPQISAISAFRCNSSGAAQDNGNYVALSAIFSGASVSGKNLISGKYRYMKAGSTWSDLTAITSDSQKIISGILPECTYTLEIQVSDAFSVISKQTTIYSSEIIMDFKAGGDGVAFGKTAEEKGMLDCGWNAHFRKHIYIDNHHSIYGYDPDTKEPVLAIDVCSADGNLVIGQGNEANKKGNTFLMGNDVLIGVGSAEERYYPYYRAGRTISINLCTAGYITSDGTQVYFTVPINMPLVGSPLITASSVNGFKIRQNGKYLYGTSSSAYALPASYQAYYQNCQLTIAATFSNVIDVTNNSSVGIQWSGKITFS